MGEEESREMMKYLGEGWQRRVYNGKTETDA